MWNPAYHFNAHVEGTLEILHGPGGSQHAVLRERHQLQIEIGRNSLLHFQQRFDREQPWIAHVHVRADRQQSFSDGPIAIAQPLWLMRGKPYESVASMWKCASMNGGDTS